MNEIERVREKIAMRLHSRDRSIMKVLCEAAPLNVSWDDLTWAQHDKYLKDADLYIKDFKQEIEKRELPVCPVEMPIDKYDDAIAEKIVMFEMGARTERQVILERLK